MPIRPKSRETALARAVATARLAVGAGGGVLAAAPRGSNRATLYRRRPDGRCRLSPPRSTSCAKSMPMPAASMPRVVQVSATIAASHQEVFILRPEGGLVADTRPMARLNISVIVEQGGRRESGGMGGGGRYGLAGLLEPAHWQGVAREALRIALVNLEAVPAPAGAFDVVLGPGWPGILLHEAVGHGLEGDFNRKKTSAFAGRMGQQVAARGVTVVDDGTIPDRRGSISVDDEGTPSGRTVLIEDGVLVGYMQDRQNARLMGVAATGNGRRESYAHIPMPRMTNTIMLAGSADPGRDRRQPERRHLCRGLWRRAGGHHQRQVRVFLHRGLPGEERRDRRAGQGRHADRRWPRRDAPDPRHRQRHGTRPRHRQLRQGRAMGAGGRGPADAADRRADGGRQRPPDPLPASSLHKYPGRKGRRPGGGSAPLPRPRSRCQHFSKTFREFASS